jgi:hypothetical protein
MTAFLCVSPLCKSSKEQQYVSLSCRAVINASAALTQVGFADGLVIICCQ